MKAYMKNMEMPWYAIDFSHKQETGIKAFAGGSIPHLMLIDKNGKILGRGRGQAYAVLEQLKTLLGKPQENQSADTETTKSKE